MALYNFIVEPTQTWEKQFLIFSAGRSCTLQHANFIVYMFKAHSSRFYFSDDSVIKWGAVAEMYIKSYCNTK